MKLARAKEETVLTLSVVGAPTVDQQKTKWTIVFKRIVKLTQCLCCSEQRRKPVLIMVIWMLLRKVPLVIFHNLRFLSVNRIQPYCRRKRKRSILVRLKATKQKGLTQCSLNVINPRRQMEEYLK